MIIRHFFTNGLFVNSYLLIDEKKRVGAIIDPTLEIDHYLEQAKQDRVAIEMIIETHVHADFMSGAQELKAALQNNPLIYCSAMGGEKWLPDYYDYAVKDQEQFKIGELTLEAWHTPGHTEEHLSWIIYDESRNKAIPVAAFTGDLLLVGSVGRPDLMGNESVDELSKKLYDSLFKTFAKLPDFIEIYPSHGSGSLCAQGIGMKLSSTLGYERQCNKWLKIQKQQEWIRSLLQHKIPFPEYFKTMKKMNLQKREPKKSLAVPLILDVERNKEEIKNWNTRGVIVDLRHPDDYASFHLKESINIPIISSFPLWAATVLPINEDLLFVVDQKIDISEAIHSLHVVGLDQIRGIIFIEQLKEKEKEWSAWSTFSPQLTVDDLKNSENEYYILDVRRNDEWNQGHIASAHHLEMMDAIAHLKEIPDEKTVAVICRSGNRASIVVSLLAKERGIKARNVKGGMEAWNALHFLCH